ncbi:MAG: FGGY family carbohydrate kinase [Geminicoccaceae bacterium]
MRDLYLAIDVGTGGIRAALVGRDGRALAYAHREHEQIVQRYGWSEQRPADWWQGTVETIGTVLGKVERAASRVAAICCCGQMHGTVLVDADGHPTLETAILWNDKRTQAQVDAFLARVPQARSLALSANVPAPAWPAFKLQWLMEHEAEAVERAAVLLMPKDWINFRLTGRFSQDVTEASLSFLMDWRSRDWSQELVGQTGVPARLLQPIRDAGEVLAGLSAEAARLTGLDEGIPVLVGAGDFPMALLGSGVVGAGLGSDVTGTSTIITLLHEQPVLSPEVSNLATLDGLWGSFTLLDAGGDAVRWARRAFHRNTLGYAEIAAIAEEAEAGSGALFFLPYLAGERFAEKPNSRAQFFGLTARHGLAELHRSVLEGVAFSVRMKLDTLEGGSGRPERIVASGGGAKSALWLKIKASMYGVPFIVPEEPESGIVGAAILMATATGDAGDLATATSRMVRFSPPVEPDPAWRERYDRMMPIHADLYSQAGAFYDRLDAL